jgi:small-conductance mechanosensitive channel
VYEKYEGTVEDIHIRATWLKTYDGRRIVIPNSDLFTHPVTVNTAFENRRLEYEFKIRNGADADQAKKIVEDLLDDAEGVLPDPRADVVVTSFDDSSVTLKARWWSRSRIGDVLIAQDQVLSMMWRALEKAQIVLSSQAAQVVLHPSSTTSGGANVLPPVAAASASEAEDGSQPET